MRLTERERFERLHVMITAMAFNRAVDTKMLAELRTDMEMLRKAFEGISHRKDDTLTTSEKISAALNKQSAAWQWYRDGILRQSLAQVQTIIILAILYIVFGGKIP